MGEKKPPKLSSVVLGIACCSHPRVATTDHRCSPPCPPPALQRLRELHKGSRELVLLKRHGGHREMPGLEKSGSTEPSPRASSGSEGC